MMIVDSGLLFGLPCKCAYENKIVSFLCHFMAIGSFST